MASGTRRSSGRSGATSGTTATSTRLRRRSRSCPSRSAAASACWRRHQWCTRSAPLGVHHMAHHSVAEACSRPTPRPPPIGIRTREGRLLYHLIPRTSHVVQAQLSLRPTLVVEIHNRVPYLMPRTIYSGATKHSTKLLEGLQSSDYLTWLRLYE